MIFYLRMMLAMGLVHPLEGVTFGDWWRLLRRERFRVSPLRSPRTAWITAMSLANSAAARRVDRRFGPAIEATRVVAPIFVLGHYRSGTTFLHELLATDPRFASPNRFQAQNPWTFLATERWRGPLVEPFMLPRRVQEDEIAYMIMNQLSPYLDWVFPRSRAGYRRYLTFRDANPAELAAWGASLDRFARSLTLKYHRPLILKSPPHTARIKAILDVFPDARFVHIRRDPYAVYVSTIGLLKAIPPIFRLQGGPRSVDVDEVLRIYAEMYEAYFSDRALIRPGQLVEIAYEDLERDPIGQLRVIYEGLTMGDFDEVRPAIEAYLATIAGYQKNRHRQLDEATRKRVGEAWAATFDAWQYPR